MVLILLPLLLNHNILMQSTSEKNSYLDEGWLFTSRIKVGNVPGMINEKVLAQCIHKHA